MKVKIKEQIEREIEITFPSFYKSTEKYCENKYYALFSEKLGLCITEGFTYRVNPESSMIDFKSLTPCKKSEIETIFIANQKLFETTFKGITVDLNSNTTTEDLEAITNGK
jgi:hypothetical protein